MLVNMKTAVKNYTVFNIFVRKLCTTGASRFFFPKMEESPKCTSLVKEAERLVGYSTSFLRFGWILNKEIIDVASAQHVQKFIGTENPLLTTAKSLLQNDQVTWGLIVLLFSKAAGLNLPQPEFDEIADIFHSQRTIAEVIEMLKTNHLMHIGVVNTEPSTPDSSEMKFGNTLALLCGDYLLSTSFHEVARLRNSHVQELISSSIRDLAEAELFGLRDSQNLPLPSKPLPLQENTEIVFNFTLEPYQMENVMGNMKAEWTLRNILGGGSLLGKSCQCTLILANYESDVQELGYNFGRSLALAWKASLEKDLFKEETFSLVSAPVMLHLQYDPNFYQEIKKGLTDSSGADYDLIRKTVASGPGLQRTQELQDEFAQVCLESLSSFSESESKTALVNIVKSL